jgi:hypothetical protein
MSDTTRKAVITTAQVQEALNEFTKTLATVSGKELETLEFDKGARGKGFAVYNSKGEVVDTFETKEEAYLKYVNWVTVATQVLQLQQLRTEVKEEVKPAKATKAAEKVSASSETAKTASA